MSWEAIPESELVEVAAATREGRCVACYGEVGTGHVFYCHGCDDGCGDERDDAEGVEK